MKDLVVIATDSSPPRTNDASLCRWLTEYPWLLPVIVERQRFPIQAIVHVFDLTKEEYGGIRQFARALLLSRAAERGYLALTNGVDISAPHNMRELIGYLTARTGSWWSLLTAREREELRALESTLSVLRRQYQATKDQS